MSVTLQRAQHQRVTAELFVSAQVAPRPPGHRVPPEPDAGEPFDPANEVVAAPNVGELVGEDPAELLRLQRVEHRGWQVDARAAADPPDQRRDARGRQVEHRRRGEVQAVAERLQLRLQRGRGSDARAAQQLVEARDPPQRPGKHARAAEQPGTAGGGPRVHRPGAGLRRGHEVHAEVDDRGRWQCVTCVVHRRCQHRHGEQRRGHQLDQRHDPEQVRDRREAGALLHQPGGHGQRGGHREVARDPQQGCVAHASSRRRASSRERSCAISSAEIFCESIRWVSSGANEPPVSLSASDSSWLPA